MATGDFPVDRLSGVPIFTQIVQRVKYLVASGRWQPGHELTPIHKFAEQLRINFNTVVKAYRELELAGIVEKRGTIGTYVANGPAVGALRDRLTAMMRSMDDLVTVAMHAGCGIEELIDLLRGHYEAVRRRQEEE